MKETTAFADERSAAFLQRPGHAYYLGMLIVIRSAAASALLTGCSLVGLFDAQPLNCPSEEQRTFFLDDDGDGVGRADQPRVACSVPDGYALTDGDCNDDDPGVRPNRTEEPCNGIDDDCDGVLDSAEDADADGYASVECGGTDCNDTEPTVHPEAEEICDRLDNDCSLSTTDRGGIDRTEDVDDDGHAPPDAECRGGPRPRDDCDDRNSDVYPGAPEICDGRDNECNGMADEEPSASDACPSFEGTETICTAGLCAITSCPVGTGDCDGIAVNGCETDTSRDPLNCGACGVTCSLACDSSTCNTPIDLSLGGDHSCALLATGWVVCWGWNEYGQLGAGLDTASKVVVRGITDAVGVSAGQNHSCAVMGAGQAQCWGENRFGTVGDGSSVERRAPVDVVGLADATQIEAGSRHTCAVRRSRQVVCWGDNEDGQLGTGSTVDSDTPIAVAALTDAVEVSAGGRHTCALRLGGQVACWGQNSSGELGNGTTIPSATPVAVSGLTDAVSISAGGAEGQRHTCARRDSGSSVCWGAGGPLGTGSTMGSPVPVPVVLLPDATQISAGGEHNCAVRPSGQASCWGSGSAGALGTGDMGMPRNVPTAVVGLTDAVVIAAGIGSHSCAIRTGGAVMCWGNNNWRQVGDGSSMGRASPVVVLPVGPPFDEPWPF